jgi:hypothetical protein
MNGSTFRDGRPAIASTRAPLTYLCQPTRSGAAQPAQCVTVPLGQRAEVVNPGWLRGIRSWQAPVISPVTACALNHLL